MRKEHYITMLRALAGLAALVLWVISVRFTNDGFNFHLPGMEWVGIALALCVTVIELIWSKEGMKGNMTILVGGLTAYAYGVYANIQGILYAQQAIGAGLLDEPMTFSIALALFIEILPEPLFVWALVGSTMNTSGDFVTNLMGMFGIQKPKFNQKGMQPQGKQGFPVPLSGKASHPQANHPPQGGRREELMRQYQQGGNFPKK